MACDRCDGCRAEGCRFCAYCGSPLECPECANNRAWGCAYCGSCGMRLRNDVTFNPPEETSVKDLLIKSGLAVAPAVAAMLILELAMLVGHSVSELGFLDGFSETLFILTPFLTELCTISGAVLQAYWVILVIAIVASAAAVFYQSRGMMTRSALTDIGRSSSTPLFWIGMLFGSTIIIELGIVLGEDILGVGLETPGWISSMTLEEMLIAFASASVWEEVVSRVLLIGVPMAVIALYHRRRDFPRFLLGGFGVSRVAVLLIVVSTVIFGMAHVPGWGFPKALPTMVGGLAMGYLYVRFGLHASILFHFLTDYMGVLMETIGELATGSLLAIILLISLVCVAYVLIAFKDWVMSIPSMPLTGLKDEGQSRRHDPVAGFDGGIEVPGFYHHIGVHLHEPGEIPVEIDVTVAHGEMGIAVAIVIVDVDVGHPVAQELEHLFDLACGIGVTDVEADGQIGTVDQICQILGLPTEHEW